MPSLPRCPSNGHVSNVGGSLDNLSCRPNDSVAAATAGMHLQHESAQRPMAPQSLGGPLTAPFLPPSRPLSASAGTMMPRQPMVGPMVPGMMHGGTRVSSFLSFFSPSRGLPLPSNPVRSAFNRDAAAGARWTGNGRPSSRSAGGSGSGTGCSTGPIRHGRTDPRAWAPDDDGRAGHDAASARSHDGASIRDGWGCSAACHDRCAGPDASGARSGAGASRCYGLPICHRYQLDQKQCHHSAERTSSSLAESLSGPGSAARRFQPRRHCSPLVRCN